MLSRFFSLTGSGFLLGFGFCIALGSVLAGIIGLLVIASREGDELPLITSEHAVALVPLEGEIMRSDKFRRVMQKTVEHDKVKAIVVKIDSPGGGVGASEEIYNTIKWADAKKPVVCSLSGIAASGGLYSALGCRKIITNRGTLTGSIGVIMMAPSFPDVLTRFGVKMNVVKSGRYKDTGSPFRDMTDEDRAMLDGLISQSYEQFVDAVATSRKLAKEDVRKFADGRVITGEEAVRIGLADDTGGVEKAARIALQAAGDSAEPDIVMPKKRGVLEQAFDPAESEVLSFFQAVTHTGIRLLYRAQL